MLSEEQQEQVQNIREQLKDGKIALFSGQDPEEGARVEWYLVYDNDGYEGKNLVNGINDRIPDEDLERAFDAFTFDGQGDVSVMDVEDAPEQIQEWACEWGEHVEMQQKTGESGG